MFMFIKATAIIGKILVHHLVIKIYIIAATVGNAWPPLDCKQPEGRDDVLYFIHDSALCVGCARPVERILPDGHHERKAVPLILERGSCTKVTGVRRQHFRGKYALNLQDIDHLASKMNPSKCKYFFNPIISGIIELILFVAARNFMSGCPVI